MVMMPTTIYKEKTHTIKQPLETFSKAHLSISKLSKSQKETILKL